MKFGMLERGVASLLRWCAGLIGRSGHATLSAQMFRVAEDLAASDAPPFAYARSLWVEGQRERARSVLEKILAADPSHSEANNLLGVLFLEDGFPELARTRFERAVAGGGSDAAPLNNLGNVCQAGGDVDSALRFYRAALACDADYVEALTNLGAALNVKGSREEAERCCRRAIARAPEFAGAHCNLGNVLLSLGRVGEAVASYREAIRLHPGLPEALVNLALALEEPGYLIGTIDYYEKQLARGFSGVLPHLRIAQALQALNRWDDAHRRLMQALERAPDDPDVLFLLGVNHCFVGDVRSAIDCLDRVARFRKDAATLSGRTFDSMYLEDRTGRQLCCAFRNWAEQYATRPLTPERPVAAADPERRIRLGYVSRDFARHSVAYFLEPIIRNHDRLRFEVYCYSTLIRGDNVTERFKGLADAWRDISTLQERQVVELVRDDGIDILVDLSGHTTGNRLGVFACKPAPVQVSYLGHPGTTGVSQIDYRICDAVTDPPDLVAGHYVERLWPLPGCFLTYQPPENSPEVKPPPVLSGKHITFGSFNNGAKINNDVIAVWARVLAAVPMSRLLLKGFSFSSERGRARVLEGFAEMGIPAERIELVDWRPEINNHLDLYGEVDIALDTFPYNGTTTTCEALWMGVPVICLEGERHAARVGASLMKALGLSELVAASDAEYVEIAARLAGDVQRLSLVRSRLRDTVTESALLDHAGFTRNLESAYREMWRAYCARRRIDAPDGRSRAPGAPGEGGAYDLAGVARIRLPESCEVMTRYVVEEQGDWFEDEIRFVRKLLGAGQVVIDVGANYGVYTLTMAARVGHSGKVFSFEPSRSTARFLRESTAINGFDQVHVIESAVSDRPGQGHLRQEAGAEMSFLCDAGSSTESDETVNLTTLDRCKSELGWAAVDFMKIDAEGHEARIVQGAAHLLKETSPLVMAEYKHGESLNRDLPERFADLSYRPYRLVPGLMLLEPVEDPGSVDPYLLNLFFCKDDRASALSAQGLLVPRGITPAQAGPHGKALERIEIVSGLDCSRDLAREWPGTAKAVTAIHSGADHYQTGLGHYAQARRVELPAAERLDALRKSLDFVQLAIKSDPTLPRRITSARIQADLGLRDKARGEFEVIVEAVQAGDAISDEPYLAPSSRFEQVRCEGEVRMWLIAAVSEWLARRQGFSSFLNPESCLHHWQSVRAAGYCESEAQRQIDLILTLRRARLLKAA